MRSRRPRLALDTSTTVGSVAVGLGDEVIQERSFALAGGHSSALLPAVDEVMSSAGFRPRDLDAIVVGAGPGSFTGVRISAATAKGMVHSLEIPLYAYSSLAAVAANFTGAGEVTCVLFDARGRDVFGACFSFGKTLEVLGSPRAMVLEEALAMSRDVGAIRVVGSGATRHAEEIRRAIDIEIVPAELGHPRAAALLRLAQRYPEAGCVLEPAAWQPDYLRPSGAERIAAERSATSSGPSRSSP